MREGTAKEIKFESIDNLFGIPNESKQHVTTMIPLESLYPYALCGIRYRKIERMRYGYR